MKIKNIIFAGVFVSLAMVEAKPVLAREEIVKKMRDSFGQFEGYLRCVRGQGCKKKERTRLIAGAASLLAIMATASLAGYRTHSQKRPVRELGEDAYLGYVHELEGDFKTLIGNGVAETLLNPNMQVSMASNYPDAAATKAAQEFLEARNRIVDILQNMRTKLARGELTVIGAAGDLSFAQSSYIPVIRTVTEKYEIGLRRADGTLQLTLTAK